MDLLADVVDLAGVRGAIAATVDAGEPWGIQLDSIPGAAFHAICGGTAWLRVAGRDPVRLMPGDVVLFPTGLPHALSSEVDGPLTPWAQLAATLDADQNRAVEIGPPPARTRILCASYRHDPAVATPLFALLPEVMHVPAESLTPACADSVRLIGAELYDPELASIIVLNRLVDVVLIYLLRGWLRSRPDTMPVSWLRALSDPTVTSALSAMHAEPARAWTLDSLAGELGVSRATLVRRFTALVGEPPATYLTKWRMDLAARRLRDTDETVDSIAGSVGYQSVYAFSRAFSRARSIPPGRYRTTSRAGRA
jgi:AraC-like DNA-binding protein